MKLPCPGEILTKATTTFLETCFSVILSSLFPIVHGNLRYWSPICSPQNWQKKCKFKYFLDKTGTTDKTDWLPFSVYNSTFLSPSNIILITLCLNFIGNTGEKVYFVWQTDGEFCPFPSLECFVWSADYRTGVLYKCLNWQLSQEITTKLFVESCNNLKRSLILLNVEPSLHLNSVF